MLLTKYKVQELIENAKIDPDDLSQNVGAFLEDGIDDDGITLRIRSYRYAKGTNYR